jgi:hypothetical protein
MSLPQLTSNPQSHELPNRNQPVKNCSGIRGDTAAIAEKPSCLSTCRATQRSERLKNLETF